MSYLIPAFSNYVLKLFQTEDAIRKRSFHLPATMSPTHPYYVFYYSYLSFQRLQQSIPRHGQNNRHEIPINASFCPNRYGNEIKFQFLLQEP